MKLRDEKLKMISEWAEKNGDDAVLSIGSLKSNYPFIFLF